MKITLNLYVILGFLLLRPSAVYSQAGPPTASGRPGQVLTIVMAGVGSQASDGFKFAAYWIEWAGPVNPHFRIQFNNFLPTFHPFGDGTIRRMRRGSCEISFSGKFFLFKKYGKVGSAFFFGPELSLGGRRMEGKTYYGKSTFKYKERNSRFMVNWGFQHRLGPAVVAFSLPFGVEKVRSPFPGGTDLSAAPQVFRYYHFKRTTFMPALQLGFVF